MVPGSSISALRANRLSAAALAWPGKGLAAIFHGPVQRLGTRRGGSFLTDVRTAPGWLSVRRPMVLMGPRWHGLGTGSLPALFKLLGRAASGWLTARAWQAVPTKPTVMPGTAWRRVDFPGACAGVQAPVDFSCEPEAGAAGYHQPVLLEESKAWMAAGEGQLIIDGTLGGGGHSEAFLRTGARVLGIDRDPEALAHARARLAGFGNRFTAWEGNFSQLHDIPEIQQGERADGLLLDLGVSSRQLDAAARGFSFQREGPLDMRMGPSSPRTAAEIVNQWDEPALVRIFFELGEEPKARRMAAAILKQRALKPFETTVELASCIEKAVGRHGRIHPATRVFQAIRMAVNEELESLAAALATAPTVLKPGGRLLVITFHSLEDRLVKQFLRRRSTRLLDEPGWPEPRPNPDYQFELLVRKAITATPAETTLNPRARSAKLRVARLLPTPS